MQTIDLLSGTITDSIRLEKSPEAIAVSPYSNMAAITNKNDNSVTLIDLSSSSIVTTITAGKSPSDIIIDQAGKHALIVNHHDNTVTNLNLTNHVITATLPVGKHPQNIALSADSSLAVVTVRENNGGVTLLNFSNIDTEAPIITVDSPSLTPNTDYTLSGFLNENASLKVNGQAVQLDITFKFSVLLSLEEGDNLIQLSATDESGNVSTVEFNVILDSIPPAMPDIGLITVSSPDTDGLVTITGDTGSVETNTRVTVTNLDTGKHITVETDSNGAFTAQIAAKIGDQLSITTTDSAGNVSDTSIIPVREPLNISITTPTGGATLVGSNILVSGTFQGPPNTGITVNGIVASTYGNQFFANSVPLSLGDNTITATATTLSGRTDTQAISATQINTSTITVTANNQEGISPLETSFTIINNENINIQQIEADFDGDGKSDLITTEPNAPIEFVYDTPGIYYASLDIIDNLNTTHENTLVIVVQNATQMDAVFSDMWNGMNEFLVAGDSAGAADFLNSSAKAKYQPVFDVLLPYMPEIIASYSALERVSVTKDIGEYAVIREFEGRKQLFLIYFLKGGDGVWRLDSM